MSKSEKINLSVFIAGVLLLYLISAFKIEMIAYPVLLVVLRINSSLVFKSYFRELKFIVVITLLGLILELLLDKIGVIHFSIEQFSIIPIWNIGFWLILSTTINSSLKRIFLHLGMNQSMAIVLGGGSLIFYNKLGLIGFPSGVAVGFVGYILSWCTIFLTIFFLLKKFSEKKQSVRTDFV